jgi:hypothetical protein
MALSAHRLGDPDRLFLRELGPHQERATLSLPEQGAAGKPLGFAGLGPETPPIGDPVPSLVSHAHLFELHLVWRLFREVGRFEATGELGQEKADPAVGERWQPGSGAVDERDAALACVDLVRFAKLRCPRQEDAYVRLPERDPLAEVQILPEGLDIPPEDGWSASTGFSGAPPLASPAALSSCPVLAACPVTNQPMTVARREGERIGTATTSISIAATAAHRCKGRVGQNLRDLDRSLASASSSWRRTARDRSGVGGYSMRSPSSLSSRSSSLSGIFLLSHPLAQPADRS